MSFTVHKRVVIVENDRILLESFSHLIGRTDKFIVAGSYEGAEKAISNLHKDRPDIVMMDTALPEMSGVKATAIIKEKFPYADVLIVTSHLDATEVFGCLRAGAVGYIAKSGNYLEVLAALEEVIKGGSPMSTPIARMVINNFHVNPNSPFTRREREVLKLMAEGKTYSQISGELFISCETTKTHIRNIYSKLQVSRRSEAIELATKNRYI